MANGWVFSKFYLIEIHFGHSLVNIWCIAYLSHGNRKLPTSQKQAIISFLSA